MTHKAVAALHSFRTWFRSHSLPESFRKAVDLIHSQHLQPYFIVAFTLWLVGAVEIVQKTTGQPLNPGFWMLLAILITSYSGLRIFRLSAGISNVRRPSRLPEVDNLMSRLASNGFTVYHEPALSKGSDSYVLVGPGGVHAMEVQAREPFGTRTIEVRSPNELVLGGRITDQRPLQHARVAAGKLRERFTGVSQVQAAVKPLVVFVNEWQVTQPNPEQEITVLNANQLEQYLTTEQPIFTKSQVAEISSYLDEPAAAIVR